MNSCRRRRKIITVQPFAAKFMRAPWCFYENRFFRHRPCNLSTFFFPTAIKHLFQKDAQLLQTQVRVTLRVQPWQWTRSRCSAEGGGNAREVYFYGISPSRKDSLHFMQMLCENNGQNGNVDHHLQRETIGGGSVEALHPKPFLGAHTLIFFLYFNALT